MVRKSWWEELVTEAIQRTRKPRAKPEPGDGYNLQSHDLVTYFHQLSPHFLRLSGPPAVATPAVGHESLVSIAYTDCDSLTTLRLFRKIT